jgi:hypothetical protein
MSYWRNNNQNKWLPIEKNRSSVRLRMHVKERKMEVQISFLKINYLLCFYFFYWFSGCSFLFSLGCVSLTHSLTHSLSHSSLFLFGWMLKCNFFTFRYTFE